MSDSLTDAQRVMAEVHLAHTASGAEGIVTCWCCEQFPSFARHSEHVSVEIDKALGGLTRERSIRSQAYNDTSMTGDLEDLVDEIDLFSADHRIESRVVGGWIPEAGQ